MKSDSFEVWWSTYIFLHWKETKMYILDFFLAHTFYWSTIKKVKYQKTLIPKSDSGEIEMADLLNSDSYLALAKKATINIVKELQGGREEEQIISGSLIFWLFNLFKDSLWKNMYKYTVSLV